MKISTTSLVLAGALGAVAHPSRHAHRLAHRSLDRRTDFVRAAKPEDVPPVVEEIEYVTYTETTWVLASDATEAPVAETTAAQAAVTFSTIAQVAAPSSAVVPMPAPLAPQVPQAPQAPQPPQNLVVPPSSSVVAAPATSVAAPAPASNSGSKSGAKSDSSSDSSSGSGVGASMYQPFCGGKAHKRATIEQIAYKGNVGSTEYGCNMKLVQSQIADKYDYTLRFHNAGDQNQKCICWLKIGPDNGINGFFSNNDKAIKFDLPPGAEQYLAVDSDTQGGCTCDAGQVQTTKNGQWAGTWTEFDAGNASNKKWSGADASCIVAAKERETDPNIRIPGMRVCDTVALDKAKRSEDAMNKHCSTIFNGGAGNNSYVGGTEDLDGVGMNIQGTPVRLDVTVDYK
ncbi:hypothetical protein CDD81_5517 [Ophiocordyceps australis]|uniref:Allergen Asp f 4 n=1 Tax=Ophiocordyceps australis TaxID=1399860 RepID=A0A2C5Y928_9HYPO|nr:hypothetical protein CDD81_5517 [Ophiocordyceps australis]